MEIRSKRKFYELWQAGVLGNRPLTWSSVHEALRSGRTRFGVREIGAAGGGFFSIAYSKGQLKRIVSQLDAQGKRYNIDGSVPNETVTLQGEVCRTERGLEGMLAIRSGTDIRSAWKQGLFKPYRGVAFNVVLEQFMDPSSREDLDALLDLYDGHVVEFACFPFNVGVLPHRNTIIWEVRKY